MKQALLAAAPGFAGACLIDEIDFTEPNIPTFVRQSSQQCQLQGWEHRRILYGAGRHLVEVCHEQSRMWVWLSYKEGCQLLAEACPRVTDGRGFSRAWCPQICGDSCFQSTGFSKWKTEVVLVPVQILRKSVSWNGCNMHLGALLLSTSQNHTATLLRVLVLGLESSLSNNFTFHLFSSQVAEQSDRPVKIPGRWHAAWRGENRSFSWLG